MKLRFFLILMLSAVSVIAEEGPALDREGFNAVKKWSQDRLQFAQKNFTSPRMPSMDFWGQQVIYQIQVDRFNNGDPSNDKLNIEEQQQREMKTNDLYGIMDYHHGGDLKGIEQRLDYLKDLGITSLWITPTFKHNGAYHGYCTTDFTDVDPSFGTKAELKNLVMKAHSKGIRVILDIVINHMCDGKTIYDKKPDHYVCAEGEDQRNWLGHAFDTKTQGTLAFSENFFGPLKSQYFFNRCGANSDSDMRGTGPAAIYGDFVSTMFDFDTSNYDFQQIFTDLHKYWIAYADVDGFRLDAAKHVSEDFIAYFSTQTRAYAKTLGKNNFFIVGEVAGPSDWIARRLGHMFTNPQNPDQHGTVPVALTKRIWDLKDLYLTNKTAPYPGMNAAYDFNHGGIAVDVLHNNQSPVNLENHFSSQAFKDMSAQNDSRLNWNLLEIHDWPRFSSHNKTSLEKSKIGMAYLGLAEGSPIIYYGQEQGFNGDCHYDKMNVGSALSLVQQNCAHHNDSLSRQDMFVNGMVRLGSTVPEINQLAYIGKITTPQASYQWQQDPYLNREHSLYQLSRKVLHLRQSCNALKFGETKFRWADSSQQGLLAFSRIDPYGMEALILINTAFEARALPMMKTNNKNEGAKWNNVFNTSEVAYSHINGSITFDTKFIASNSVMVFIPENNLGSYQDSIGITLCLK